MMLDVVADYPTTLVANPILVYVLSSVIICIAAIITLKYINKSKKENTKNKKDK